MEHSNKGQGMIDRCIVEGLSKTKLLLKNKRHLPAKNTKNQVEHKKRSYYNKGIIIYPKCVTMSIIGIECL